MSDRQVCHHQLLSQRNRRLTLPSCWNILGQAVRLAQSLGLHVETRPSRHRSQTELEKRRRIWYSIYVLDRLLSLQLGRPPAIHDDDCHVELPSRHADCDIDWSGDWTPTDCDTPSTGDYFLAVIAFSKIVGHVLRDIYSPHSRQSLAEHVRITGDIDRQLIEWKTNLPRRLRFDLGHAFDSNFIFRRQVCIVPMSLYHIC